MKEILGWHTLVAFFTLSSLTEQDPCFPLDADANTAQEYAVQEFEDF